MKNLFTFLITLALMGLSIGAANAQTITPSLPNGTVGVAYNQTLTINVFGTKVWSITQGNLPGGLTLTSGGVISGTPTTAGTFKFTVGVQIGASNYNGQLSITIDPAPIVNAAKPVISNHPQNVTVNVGDVATLSVTASVSDGGVLSYQWYFNGVTDIAVPGATGSSIKITPQTAGTESYYVIVTNTNSSATGNKNASVTSNVAKVTANAPAPPVCEITTGGYTNDYATLDDALAAVPTGGTTPTTIKLLANIDYSKTLSVVNKKITFDMNGKDLNVEGTNGLEVDTGGNVFISGIGNFNVAGGLYGTYINASGDKATVTNVTGGGWSAYARQGGELTVLGNVTINGLSGVGAFAEGGGSSGGGTKITIEGTITVPDGATYIQVGTTPKTKYEYEAVTTKEGYLTYTDGSNTVWVKSTGTAPTITTTSLPNGTVGTAYSQTLQAIGDTPITWSVSAGSLPGGLNLSATTGMISGTPTANGTFNFTIRAANAVGSDTKALSITINAAPVVNAATPVISSQPQYVTVKVGDAATLSVTASISDSGTLSYQWFSNTTKSNSESDETVISGATGSSYSPSTTTAGTYYYYVMVRNDNSSVTGTKTAITTSDVATVTVRNGTGINAVRQAIGLKAWVQGGMLHVSGLTAGKPWRVYTVTGVLVTSPGPSKGGEEVTIPLPGHGVYIVQSGNWAVKVIN